MHNYINPTMPVVLPHTSESIYQPRQQSFVFRSLSTAPLTSASLSPPTFYIQHSHPPPHINLSLTQSQAKSLISTSGGTFLFQQALLSVNSLGIGRMLFHNNNDKVEEHFPIPPLPQTPIDLYIKDYYGNIFQLKFKYWSSKSSGGNTYILENIQPMLSHYGLKGEEGDVLAFYTDTNGDVSFLPYRVREDAVVVVVVEETVEKEHPAISTSSPPKKGAGRGRGRPPGSKNKGTLVRERSSPPKKKNAGRGRGRPPGGGSSSTVGAGRPPSSSSSSAKQPKRATTDLDNDNNISILATRDFYSYWGVPSDVVPPVDGIFRVVLGEKGRLSKAKDYGFLGEAAVVIDQKTIKSHTATIVLNKEMYRAFFETREEAKAVMVASGVSTKAVYK